MPYAALILTYAAGKDNENQHKQDAGGDLSFVLGEYLLHPLLNQVLALTSPLFLCI